MTKKKWVFFVGPGKTGSSWLYQNLLNHPDVKLPKNIKETNYFLQRNKPCREQFESVFFKYGEPKKINLDISNTYIYQGPELAKKLKSAFPESKIIIGYRDPVERVLSALLFKKRNGEIKYSTDITEALKSDKYNLISTNKYNELCSPYVEIFGLENIFIFNFNTLKSNPEKLLNDLFNFLEVRCVINSNTLTKRINPASRFRIKLLSKYSKHISGYLRRNGFHKILTVIKTNTFFRKILFKQIPQNDKDVKDKQIIFQILEKEGVLEDEKKFKKKFELWN